MELQRLTVFFFFCCVSAKDAAEEKEEKGKGGFRWQGEFASSLWQHLCDEMASFQIVDCFSVAFHVKAPPKEVPKTIENQRVYDETTVDPGDEEVLRTISSWVFSPPKRIRFNFCTLLLCQVAFDEATDEFSAYFNKLTNPKVLITTSDRPRGVSTLMFRCILVSFGVQLKWVLQMYFIKSMCLLSTHGTDRPVVTEASHHFYYIFFGLIKCWSGASTALLSNSDADPPVLYTLTHMVV